MQARLHAMEPRSRANGPGVRTVVWFQGCTLGCVGCFNPATHAQVASPATGGSVELDAVIGSLASAAATGIEGLTLSGGEPMQQIDAAIALLAAARLAGLSTLMFSGYTIEEIQALPRGGAALAFARRVGRRPLPQRLAVGPRLTRLQQSACAFVEQPLHQPRNRRLHHSVKFASQQMAT